MSRVARLARGLGLDSYTPPDAQRGEGAFYEPTRRIIGEKVTVDTALGLGTVYACIRILADTVGSTPILAYREQTPGDRQRARETPAWHVLHDEPNPSQSPVDLWTQIATWVVGWGDAFLGKQFATNGELVALWGVHPKNVEVELVNGRKRFHVTERDGKKKTYTQRDMIHVMGPSFDGLRGASPITIARRELAVAMAAQKYVTAVYENTGVPRGALLHERELTPDAMKQLRADWQRIYGGTANAGKIAILEEGMKFEPISMPMRDVQFVEQQQLSIQTTARIFRIPLSLIQADSPGGLTYKTAETENLQFLTHSVRPWYVRIEQALNRDPDVFPARPVDFCEFLPEALLRVATAERFAAYSVATGGKPWMEYDEVRDAENLPRREIVPAPAPTAPAGAPSAAQEAEVLAERALQALRSVTVT